MKSLIVYFSRTDENYMEDGIRNIEKGNTEIVAETIQKLTGADLFKVETVNEYPYDYYKCCDVAKEENNINITVINPKFLTGLDTELLEKLKENHSLVIALEDGELMGGYGQNIASYYGTDKMLVKNYGISKKFHTDFNTDELLDENESVEFDSIGANCNNEKYSYCYSKRVNSYY